MYHWDRESRCIKDLILKNSLATQEGVSEMKIHIKQFSAIDTNGNEHYIIDFPGQRTLTIKGYHGGSFLRSRSVVTLAPGEYKSLRFYVNDAENSFVYSDGSEVQVRRLDHLDFEIEGGLTLTGNESPEVILRFDFEPFKPMSFLWPIRQFFTRSRTFAGRLTSSLSR